MRRLTLWIVAIALATLCWTSPGLSAEPSPEPSPEPAAEVEEASIRATLQKYIDGTSYNRTEQIASAFYEEAELFLSHPEKELYILPISEYLGFFANKEVGKFNGREGEILSVDLANDIAMAKAEIRSTTNEARYIDIFLLKKLEGEWKIISKAATRIQ